MSRNKKYNPRKSNEALLRQLLKDRLFIHCTSVSDDMFSTDRKGNEINVSPLTMRAIADTPQKWTLHLICGCYDSKGNQDIKELIVGNNQYLYHYQLLDSIREEQAKQIKDLNSKNVKILFVGWIAFAQGEELSSSEVDVILEKIGAWNE